MAGKHDEQLGHEQEQPGRGVPDGRHGEHDEDRAADDPGDHLAPSATGDGLIPPYRRSRFW